MPFKVMTQVILIVTLALSLAPIQGQAAHSPVKWSQRQNYFEEDGDTHNCGFSSEWPCVEWPQSKLQVEYFFVASVNEYVRDYVRAAAKQYNALCAMHPEFREIPTGDGLEIRVERVPLDHYIWGQVQYFYTAPIKSSTGRWNASLTSVILRFSTKVTYNTDRHYSSTDADVRSIAAHELGHSLGLGHADYRYSVMTQGAYTYDRYRVPLAPGSGDHNGLSAIYGSGCTGGALER